MPTISIYFQGGLVWESGRFSIKCVQFNGSSQSKNQGGIEICAAIHTEIIQFSGSIPENQEGLASLLLPWGLKMISDFESIQSLWYLVHVHLYSHYRVFNIASPTQPRTNHWSMSSIYSCKISKREFKQVIFVYFCMHIISQQNRVDANG